MALQEYIEKRRSVQRRVTNGNAANSRDIKPMLAVLVDKPFTDPEWLFEIKWDGYRAICYVEDGNATFMSRNQIDFTDKYPALRHVAEFIRGDAVIDGEIVALDKDGKPSFLKLHNELRRSKTGIPAEDSTLVFEAFDLLFIDGASCMTLPLIERKKRLREVIVDGGPIRYCDHVLEQGEQFFEMVRARGLEGVVAKEVSSPYVQRRDSRWLKIKNIREQEVVIGGFTKPRRSRTHFGSLVIGLYEGNNFKFCGHVGTGFGHYGLDAIAERLKPLVTEECPFNPEPATNEPATWVRPELVCQVKLTEWTADGLMRHPVFIAVREDKKAVDCHREIARGSETEVKSVDSISPNATSDDGANAPMTGDEEDVTVDVSGGSVHLTHLSKGYWPEDGYTKRDLIEYYHAIAPTMLPYLKDRPVVIQRYPSGYKGQSFYQHDLPKPPSFMRIHEVTEDGGKVVHYAVPENEASLLYLANLGAIPIHAWNSTVRTPNLPDWVVFDLDPDQSDWDTACEIALAFRTELEGLGLLSYVKTSGSQGLHIFVPLIGSLTYTEVVDDFAGPLSAMIVAANPAKATIRRIIRDRKDGQVYIDYQQNGEGKTVVAPYSARPKPGATASTPVTWDEVEARVDPHLFTIKTVPGRVAKLGDLFGGVLKHKQDIRSAIDKLSKQKSGGQK